MFAKNAGRQKMRNKITALLLIVLTVFLCGCSYDAPQKSDKLSVVCSIFAPYDFARQVAGDRAEVKMLLPTGVESHSYEPTPKDIIELEDCDIFFYVSEHTETWVTQMTDAVNDIHAVEIADELGIEINGHEHHHGEEAHDEHDEHDEGETDEHIWTNLETAARMVSCVAKKMGEKDPKNASYYVENANLYIKDILELKGKLDELVKTSKRKEIISGSRFAMKNFTHEFGLEYTAAFDSCVDNTEPSASVMAHIIDKIKTDKLPVIFYEELTEPKIAKAVSTETGVKMLLLHSCHNISSDEMRRGETYLSLMTQNYYNLKEALN